MITRNAKRNAVVRALRLTGAAAVVVAAGTALPASAESPSPSPSPTPMTISDIDAKSWVIADAATGNVLAEHDAHRRLPPASTLKVLTAYTLMPRLMLNSTYIGCKMDSKAEGNTVGIEPGGTYKVSDLFHGLLLPSANDAAMALANAYGGKQAAVAAMNAEAARLHAHDTVVKGPSGLDEPGQVTSAFDLATIFRAAIGNPTFRGMVKIKETPFPGPVRAKGHKKRERTIVETLNPLLREDYPGLIGGKTGYTTQAGRTFVVAAKRGGRTIVAAMMNYTTPTDESGKVLLEWGFDHAGIGIPVDHLPVADPETAPVIPHAAGHALPAQDQVRRPAGSAAAGNPATPPAMPTTVAVAANSADWTSQVLVRTVMALLTIVLIGVPLGAIFVVRNRRRRAS